jgi:cobalamin biosynthesis Mg chelatase CobN
MPTRQRQVHLVLDEDGARRPAPDPTELTTAALQREVSNLRELFGARLDAMDKAVELFTDNLTRVPTDTDKQIVQLRDLIMARMETITVMTQERFNSVEMQFKERDTRTEQTSRDSKIAVDAALQAAKEAVGEQNRSSALAIAKSETATAKQIDQLTTLIQTTAASSDSKITDNKDRVTRIEAVKLGGQETTNSQQASALTITGIIIAVAAFGSVIVDILVRHTQ